MHTPSGPRDAPLWGSHPLIPVIACLLVGKTAGDLTGAKAGALLAALRKASVGGRRERGGVADWMAHQLNTGPYPGNHVGERTRGGRGEEGENVLVGVYCGRHTKAYTAGRGRGGGEQVSPIVCTCCIRWML